MMMPKTWGSHRLERRLREEYKERRQLVTWSGDDTSDLFMLEKDRRGRWENKNGTLPTEFDRATKNVSWDSHETSRHGSIWRLIALVLLRGITEGD
jgi:hypothetical protein